MLVELTMNKLYSLYSQSPKQSRTLENCCKIQALQCNKIGRVLDVRWVSSSLRTVNAVWKQFPGLRSHFKESSEEDKSNDKNTVSIVIGLQKKAA